MNKEGDAGKGNDEVHTSNANSCFICFDDETEENPFVRDICLCKGSMAGVHQSCIDNWVLLQQHSSCASCKCEYYVLTEYKNGTPHPPKTLQQELWCVFVYVVLPTMWSMAKIVALGTFQFIVMPVVYGLVFFHFSALYNLLFLADYEQLWKECDLIMGGQVWLFGTLALQVHSGFSRAYSGWLVFFEKKEQEDTKLIAYTNLEAFFNILKKVERIVGYGRPFAFSEKLTILFGVICLRVCANSFFIRCALFVAIFFIGICWRVCWPSPKLKDKRRRFEEPFEYKPHATLAEINRWFIIYVLDVVLFSFIVPFLGGLVAHYATAPLLTAFPDEISIPSFFSFCCHWMIGALWIGVLLRSETMFMIPLFAPGVDLYIIRAVDMQDHEEDIDAKGFMFVQVFDVDILRVLWDFSRVILLEAAFLALFISGPIRISLGIAQTLAPFVEEWVGVEVHSLTALPLPFWASSAAVNFTCLAMLGVITMCFTIFPIQKLGLRACVLWVYSVASWLDLSDFLFDKERQEIFHAWMNTQGDEEIVMPTVPLERMFVRRERWLYEPDAVPRFLQLRIFIFSTIFFVLGGAVMMFPFVLPFTFALLVGDCTVVVTALSGITTFCLWSPKKVLMSAVQLLVTLITVFIAFPILAISQMWVPINLSVLAKEAFDLRYAVKRKVAPLASAVKEADSSSESSELMVSNAEAEMPWTDSSDEYELTEGIS